MGHNTPIPKVDSHNFSGFNFSRSDTTEITLTGSPAVDNAMFRVIRSVPDKVEKAEPVVDEATQQELYSLHQIPIVQEDTQMQVFGYVLVPWIEDWYGDIFDPRGVESAAHSFLKSVSAGTADGPGGVGENHWRWMANGYPIQSVVDYTGNIGGIPGGWWVGLQITNPETWGLIKDRTYTGFSIGCYVNGTNYHRENAAKEALWDKVSSSFARRAAKAPGDKATKFQFPGLFGFPKTAESYADPVNCMYPIDTNGRALAVAQYLLDMGKSANYSNEEVRYMVGRALVSAQDKGVVIPDTVIDRLNMPPNKASASRSVPESTVESIEVSPSNVDETPVDKEGGMVTKVVDAVVSKLKSVFIDKEGTKKLEEVSEEVFDMDRKELLELLASDEARTAILGDLPDTMTKLSEAVSGIAEVVSASAGLTAAAVVTKEPTEMNMAPVVPVAATGTEETAPVAPATPTVTSFSPLDFLSALEKHSSNVAETVALAVTKAMASTKTDTEGSNSDEKKALSVTERLDRLTDALGKLDKSMAERASVAGALTVEAQALRQAQEEAAYLKANPFEAKGAVFKVGARRAAVPIKEANTAAIDDDAETSVAKASKVVAPFPSQTIDPNAHPAFRA